MSVLVGARLQLFSSVFCLAMRTMLDLWLLIMLLIILLLLLLLLLLCVLFLFCHLHQAAPSAVHTHPTPTVCHRVCNAHGPQQCHPLRSQPCQILPPRCTCCSTTLITTHTLSQLLPVLMLVLVLVVTVVLMVQRLLWLWCTAIGCWRLFTEQAGDEVVQRGCLGSDRQGQRAWLLLRKAVCVFSTALPPEPLLNVC